MTTKSLLVAALLATSTLPASADPTAAQKTLKEVEGMLGFVPAFFRQIPEALLPGWWDQSKQLEFNPKSALDGKTKELIGLAVAAQIPCDYCVYFHTKVAKLNGATDAQISEALGMAALTRFGSTLMHGAQVDIVQYKKDVDRAFKPHGK